MSQFDPYRPFATVNWCVAKGIGSPTLFGGSRSDRRSGQCCRILVTAKCDGKARPMAVITGNNLQTASNLLDEPEDEFHPKPVAIGGRDTSR
jgi:hypothetical protein